MAASGAWILSELAIQAAPLRYRVLDFLAWLAWEQVYAAISYLSSTSPRNGVRGARPRSAP